MDTPSKLCRVAALAALTVLFAAPLARAEDQTVTFGTV
jgi:hypothetical protein